MTAGGAYDTARNGSGGVPLRNGLAAWSGLVLSGSAGSSVRPSDPLEPPHSTSAETELAAALSVP